MLGMLWGRYRPLLLSLFVMQVRGTSLVAKFILTLFITRFMGLEDLGLYGLVSAAAIVFPVFSGLGIVYYFARRAVTQTQEDIVHTIGLYGRFIALVYAAVFLCAGVSGAALGQMDRFLLIAAVVALEHVNNDAYILLLNLSRPLAANLLHFLRTAAWIFVFMPVAWFWPALRSVDVLLALWGAGSAVAFCGFFVVMRRWPWGVAWRARGLFGWVRGEAALAWPMYAQAMALSASQYADRYLITLFLGLELTGVYVFFVTVASALSNLLQTGVVQIARPDLVRAFQEKDPRYLLLRRSCMQRAVALAAGMAVMAAGGIYVLLPYLDRPLAAAWFPVLAPVLAALVINIGADAHGLLFYSQNEDKKTLRLCLVIAGVTLALDAVLIPSLGLWGAGAAMLAAAVVRVGYQAVLARGLTDAAWMKAT